ncbi:hypothetical protein KAR91_08835 [Candidatus Pacearchaeota archaeon]|nr:hypothetical protein [Candidatus Pacearchaeota archaeon]
MQIIAKQKWTFGVGANQCNLLYHDTITLASGANTTLDLFASGSLVDAFGNALTMAAIKFLFVRNNSPDSTLNVFGGVSLDLLIAQATSDIVDVPAGGFFMWTGPTAAGIVTSTNKNLYLSDDGAGAVSITVDVVAMGLD